MSIRHLTDDELDIMLCGEPLPAGQEAHLHGCLVCRRRRDAFLAVVEADLEDDPDEATLAGIREQALARWQGRKVIHWWRWAAAAAAVVLLALLPVLRGSRPAVPAFNPETVMAEVDRALAEDPLVALASEDVVNELMPVAETTGEGSNS
jgi:predicted anti-sigma-YlaC factor YlaD